MFGIWTLLGVSVLGLIGLGFYFGYHLVRLGKPTKGDAIHLPERPNAALVVIDVQEDFTRRTGKQGFDPNVRDQALAEINRRIAAARSAGQHVIFIKNIFRDWPVILIMKLIAGGIGTPGREGLKIDRAIDLGDEPVFEKAVGDTFSAAEFEAFLAEKKIGKLTLVGLDACHCVQLTAKGGLARGYEVDIPEPSLLTATPDKWQPMKQELMAAGAAFS